MKNILRDVLITLAIALAIFFLLQLLLGNFVVHEYCMEPGLQEGDRILVSKIVYWFDEPERGDVIILEPPFEADDVFVKRLIAQPGDTVEIKNGVVYVNGVGLDEPYIMEAPTYTLPLTEMGEDEYFVLGDNRNNANDSHSGWTISRDDIVGKAWFRYWPLDRWGAPGNYSLAGQVEGTNP